MTDQLRIGVIGLGVISKFYLAAFDEVPSARLTAVCDLREDALRPFAGSDVATLRDHRELLRRDDVDAIVVNVPNNVHGEVVRDALVAGRSVCVEKPLTIDLDEGRELTGLAAERGLTLTTAFHRRYNDNVLALLRRLPPGTPIESLTVRYNERIEEHVGRDGWYLDPDRCGGGCVADNGPNAFDVVRLFLGDVSVEESDVVRDAQGLDRQATVRLRSAAGVPATVELDWSYPYGEQKDVEVRLADGTVDRADMLDGHTEFKGSLWHEYVGILDEFVRLVRAGDPASHGGLAALELVHAAYAAERHVAAGTG
ncbi:MAG TPA: Gfo/Idh/MocA family oxidoreductase [Streptosporangiaceae bacterium]|nr:Gfo/Idh/MocA family oxidoreductase [Streptosporangiaceae bacterium]